MRGHLNVKLFNTHLVYFRLMTFRSAHVTCQGILSKNGDY